MTKPFLNLDPYAVKAELYGIFKKLPQAELCEHKTCGYKNVRESSCSWIASAGNYKTIKRIPGKLVKCSFERFAKCTTQELSDPTKDIEYFAAINVWYNHKVYDNPAISSAIFLHNLIEDKVKDKWFQHAPHGAIQPHSQIPSNWCKPSEIGNLRDVLDGMKKEL